MLKKLNYINFPKKMSANFKYSRWDPTLISSQIVAIQSTYYLTLGIVVVLFSHLAGHYPTLEQFFNFQVFFFKDPKHTADFIIFSVG